MGAPAIDDAAVTGLLSRLEELRPEIIDAMVARISTEIDDYGARSEPVFGADVRAQVDFNYGALLASVRSAGPPDPRELGPVRAMVSRRAAAGMRMEDVLHAFRVGHRVFWEEILAVAESEPDGRDAALAITGHAMQYIDAVSNHIAEAWLEGHGRRAVRADRIARDLLEDLLAGRPSTGRTSELALELRLADAGLVVAVVGDDGEALPAVARALARAWPGGTRPLAVIRQDELVVIGHAPGRGVGAACEALGAAVLGAETALRAGIAPACRAAAEIPRAYAEARAALARRQSPGVTALPLLSPLDYLLTVADDTARRLIPDKLRAVVEQEPELLATLEAYADCDLNVRRTAGVLGLHPNTVHDRLRRLGDKVGTDARRVHAVVDLLITARLLTR